MKKTAEDHWNYIEALTRATMPAAGNTAADFTVDELIALIGFHYKSAFIHGWKHALEAQHATETLTSETTAKTIYAVDPTSIKLHSEYRYPEATPCARDLRAAAGNLGAVVSAVSGSARRACDADNSGEKPLDSIYGPRINEVDKEYIETFLKEDR